MKFFFVFIFCSLTPFISTNEYYNPSTKCRCVDREQCSFKFSTLIEPRNTKHYCPGYQVCCKPEHIIPTEHFNIDNYDDDQSDLSDYNFINPKPSNLKCGLRTKISAYKRLTLPASYAALGEFPWQAAVLRNYTEGYVFVSSGVLIDRDIILTTAHNVEKLKASSILVRLGENNVQADPKRKFHYLNAKVKRILIKDDFNSDTLENDFAVLCLEKKVKCNEVVNPICLPGPNDIIKDNQRCVVTGWGKNSYHGNYSSILRKAYLNLVPFKKCQFLIRKRISDPNFVLDKSFTCAGGELGKDACTGDAGGPLSCPNNAGQQILAGIVSWGIGCGEKNVPGVYANVRDPTSLNWIKNIAISECRKSDNSVVDYVKVSNPNKQTYNNPNLINKPIINPNNPNYNPNYNPNGPNLNNPNFNQNFNGFLTPTVDNYNNPNYNPNYNPNSFKNPNFNPNLAKNPNGLNYLNNPIHAKNGPDSEASSEEFTEASNSNFEDK